MPKPKRTAEEVCIEYAIAVESVREQTRILLADRCPESSRGGDAGGGYYEPPTPSCRGIYLSMPKDTPAEIGAAEVYASGGDDGACEVCVRHLKAYVDRQTARKRLGAAKRAVEAVGKRLNVAVPA